ncbi:MAG TPA: OsmC family protein [Thermoanaerobaculia bacterium]|nr:OsmC family protein [Thermoanaerobaculia bacterium]
MAGPVIARAGTALRTDIEAANHRLVVDEPLAAGGSDAGPTPYDFLSAALGGCTSMTMRVVANRENIPLQGVEITVTSDRQYAKDCSDCTSTAGYIHRFDVRIKLTGDLSDAQRERLLAVAKRCPVAKTLTSEIRIEESLV